MRKKLLLSFMVLFCQYLCVQVAAGVEFDAGGLHYYSISGSETDVSCYGISDKEFSAETLTIPGTVEYNGTTYNVTTINGSAFNSTLSSVKSIVISEGITTIEEKETFAGCINAEALTLPSTLTTIPSYVFDGLRIDRTKFVNNSSLTSDNNWGIVLYDNTNGYCVSSDGNLIRYLGTETNITFPSNVKFIGGSVFSGNTSLTTVTIPETITRIGSCAFYGCTSLKSVTINGTALESIGAYAFQNCTSLENFVIPSSVTSLGKYAFYGCTNLKSATINSTALPTIDSYTFSKCTSLNQITIPSCIETIESYAFYNCTSLKSVTINGAGLKTIGQYAFNGCSSLRKLNIPSSLTLVYDYAFTGLYMLDSEFTSDNSTFTAANIGITLCSKITDDGFYVKDNYDSYSQTHNYTLIRYTGNATELVIPSDVNTIDGSLFKGNTTITSVTMPSSMQYIMSSAFYECTSLKTVVLDEALSSIGSDAFSGDAAITSVDFKGASVSLYNKCFYNCTSLAEIKDYSKITYIGREVFNGALITSIAIPSNINYISAAAFHGCSKVGMTFTPGENSNYVVENGVIYPKNNKDYIVMALPTVEAGYTIPTTVTSVWDYAFEGCSNINSIAIPSTVTSIGIEAFGPITEIFVTRHIPLSVSANIVSNPSGSKLHVPTGRRSNYTSATYWKNFGTIVADQVGDKIISEGDCGTYYGNIKWKLDDDGQLTITGQPYTSSYTPSMQTYTKGNAPWYSFGSEIKRIMVTGRLTLSQQCFYGLTNVKYLETPCLTTNGKAQTFGSLFNVSTSYTRDSYSNYTYKYHYNCDIPASLDTLMVTAEAPEIASFGEYIDNSQTSTSGNYTYNYYYKTNNLDKIKHLYIAGAKNLTNFTGSNVANTLTGVKETRIKYLTKTMTQGMFLYYPGLTYLNIPVPGQSQGAGTLPFSTLFYVALSSVDNCIRVEQGNYDGHIPTTLKEVVIQDTCTYIPENCFMNCTMLEKVSLPSTIKGVGEKAFYNCVALTELHSDNGVPPVAWDNTFTGVNKLTCSLYVPATSRDLYKKATGWKYFSYIQDDGDECYIAITNNILKAGSILGNTYYAPGETVSLDARPNEGYTFTEWQENGTSFSIENPLTFTAERSRSITAVFTPKQNADNNLRVSQSAKGGIVFSWTPEANADFYTIQFFRDADKTDMCASYKLDADGNIIYGGNLAKSLRGGTGYSLTTSMQPTKLSAELDALDANTQYYYDITSYDAEGSKINVFVGDFNSNGTTGINNVNADVNGVENCYNLQGQKVNANSHGIFIINGKKVIR